MTELFEQLRKLLQPMIKRGGLADQVERDIGASGIVPRVLSVEPRKLISKASEFFDREDELLSLLIQVTRIYGKTGSARGLAFASYHLARIHQRNWPLETVQIYTPLLQLTVATIEAQAHPKDDERELLLYALEHLAYACEDRRDFAGSAGAFWKGSLLAEERNDIGGALHLCGNLLGDHFEPVLGKPGLPDREKVIERLEELRHRAESPEHAISVVGALAAEYINRGDHARGRKMLEEMLRAFPHGPADEEFQPYWDQARVVLATLDRIATREAVPAYASELAEAAVLATKDRFVETWTILQRVPIPDDPGVALSCHFLRAYCLLQFGRFVEALAEIDVTLAVSERLAALDPRDASLASLHLRMQGHATGRGEIISVRGEVLHRLRRFEEARAAYREAITLMSSEGSKEVIWSHHNLANLLREHGELTNAEAAYEECIRIAKSSCEPRVEVRATGNLGLLRFVQGRFADGVAKLNEAIALAHQHGDHWAATHFQTNLVTQLATVLDEAPSSLDWTQVVSAIESALGGLEGQGNQLMALTARGVRARLAAAEGRRADAAEDYRLFWTQLQAQLDSIAGAQDVAEVFRSHRSSLRAMTQFYFDSGDPVTASCIAECARDGGLLLLRRETAPPPGGDVPRQLIETLERAMQAVAVASAETHFGRIAQGSAMSLQRAREEYRAIADEIERIDPEWAAAQREMPTVLDRHDAELIIELCDTNTGTHFLFRQGEMLSSVFVSRDESKDLHGILGELYPPAPAPRPDPALIERMLSIAGAILFRAWKDILPPRDSRILVIPSGRWVGVPFHAVENPDSHQPLGETYRVGTSPSLGALHRAHTAAVTKHAGLLIADPDGSLPGARREAEILSGRYSGLFDCLSGAEAKRANVLGRVKDAGWLHFSCHGFFHPAAPSQSSLLMSDGLLSAEMLLRAGRGYRGVVFSACEVGRSASDGLDPLGMAGIALAAGARCVLAPLWAIDDAATTQFMELVYRHLESVPLGDATSRARRDLRSMRRYRAPVHWAAFQASGAPFHSGATPFL